MSDQYKYTIFDHGRKVVSLDSLEIAHQAIEQLGGASYIQYNESGINEYVDSQPESTVH